MASSPNTLLPPRLPLSLGRTYYISTRGSDSNRGTLSKPWRTIQKALNTLKPGQQGFVRGGTYSQSLVMKRAGTASAPITVRAYPGEHPVIQPGGNNSMDYPVRITAGAAWFRMSGFIVEKAPLDTTVNVYISDGQKAQPYAAHDIEFSYNEVRNGKGTGLLVAPRTNNVQLIGNLVHDNGLGTQHQHQGLYFQGQNGLIANNVVYNQPHGFGIQVRGEDTDIYANNIIVVGNTSVGNQLAGFVVENTAGNVKLINNISAFNGTYGIHAYYCCGSTAPGNEAYNNILFGNPSGPTRVNGTIIDFSKGNTVADPPARRSQPEQLPPQAGEPRPRQVVARLHAEVRRRRPDAPPGQRPRHRSVRTLTVCGEIQGQSAVGAFPAPPAGLTGSGPCSVRQKGYSIPGLTIKAARGSADL